MKQALAREHILSTGPASPVRVLSAHVRPFPPAVALKAAMIDFPPFPHRARFSNQGPLPRRSIGIDH